MEITSIDLNDFNVTDNNVLQKILKYITILLYELLYLTNSFLIVCIMWVYYIRYKFITILGNEV